MSPSDPGGDEARNYTRAFPGGVPPQRPSERPYVKTTVSPLDDNKVRITVEVPVEEFERQLEHAGRDISRKVRIPGFRKGKVPLPVLRQHVGIEAIQEEAVRHALPEYLAKAVVAEEIEMIGRPRVEDVSGGLDEPFRIEAVVETRPEIEIPDLAGIEVTLDTTPEATDEDVSREVDALRDRFAELDVVTRPAHEGDYCLVNIEGHVHAEKIESLTRTDYLYEVGSDSLVPKLDSELAGARAGDILKFNVEIPEGAPERAGEEVAFSVLVKEVKEKVLPEADDDWAQEASEFDTLAELREEIGRRVTAVKRYGARLQAQGKALTALRDHTGLKAPETLVEDELTHRRDEFLGRLRRQGVTAEAYLEATGDTEEAVIERLRAEATSAVEGSLLLRALAEHLGVEATEEEVEQEIEGAARRSGEEPAALRKRLVKNGSVGSVAGGIVRAKALAELVDRVKVTDPDGNVVELSAGPGEPTGGEPGSDQASEVEGGDAESHE